MFNYGRCHFGGYFVIVSWNCGAVMGDQNKNTPGAGQTGKISGSGCWIGDIIGLKRFRPARPGGSILLIET